MEIGRVVGSNDHADYLVQVYGPAEMPTPTTPLDRSFGQFVEVPIDQHDRLIGVIYTTQLLNPEYGALGPRLSTPRELTVFSPDYLAETATIVGVAVVGSARDDGGHVEYDQRTPRLASAVDAVVSLLPDDRLLAFHQFDGRLRLAYFPRLLARPFPSLPDLLCSIVDRLIVTFPGERRRLEVARQNIRWRAAVEVR
ncbi:MAG TPA: hypothetical protein VNL16_13760 [Chloroflexota bacterium]|nr:hypothetical protein [Chloroflexota bacterium]